jgi:hypothetical protein
MSYQNVSVWIFSIVIVLFALLFLFGYSMAAFWIMLLVPALLVWQAYSVLTTKDVPEKTFDEEWYDHK